MGRRLVTTPGGAKDALLSAAGPVVFTTVIDMIGVKTMARTRPGLSPPPSTSSHKDLRHGRALIRLPRSAAQVSGAGWCS